jgi:uncharacterized membrane protein
MELPGKASMLAALLGGGGALHLVRPTMYDWLVPPELGNPRTWVLASGVVEICVAALLVAPATRRLGGWSATALLLAFVPAHLHTFRVIPNEPLPMAGAIGRLPLQVPMVTAALDVARGR